MIQKMPPRSSVWRPFDCHIQLNCYHTHTDPDTKNTQNALFVHETTKSDHNPYFYGNIQTIKRRASLTPSSIPMVRRIANKHFVFGAEVTISLFLVSRCGSFNVFFLFFRRIWLCFVWYLWFQKNDKTHPFWLHTKRATGLLMRYDQRIDSLSDGI